MTKYINPVLIAMGVGMILGTMFAYLIYLGMLACALGCIAYLYVKVRTAK